VDVAVEKLPAPPGSLHHGAIPFFFATSLISAFFFFFPTLLFGLFFDFSSWVRIQGVSLPMIGRDPIPQFQVPPLLDWLNHFPSWIIFFSPLMARLPNRLCSLFFTSYGPPTRRRDSFTFPFSRHAFPPLILPYLRFAQGHSLQTAKQILSSFIRGAKRFFCPPDVSSFSIFRVPPNSTTAFRQLGRPRPFGVWSFLFPPHVTFSLS